MPGTPLPATRHQILAFRRATGLLGERRLRGKRSLRRIAWAGLQDSMPRAAVLSVHARMTQTDPTVWENPAYVQVWGPRYSVFVVPVQDIAVFTLGRFPEKESARRRADDLAERLRMLLDGGASMPFGEAGRALGVGHNMLRYAAPTGRFLLRWDGARQPTIRSAPPPEMDVGDARKELARRFLHVYGPSTPDAFAAWAGVPLPSAVTRFDELRRSLTEVATPIGTAWILNRDVEALQQPPGDTGAVRLLPSGDAYYLLQGRERELLVPRAEFREQLWTSRVWPGAVLADGDILGTWRRSRQRVTVQPWVRVTKRVREAVGAEAASLPLPDADAITVDWDE